MLSFIVSTPSLLFYQYSPSCYRAPRFSDWLWSSFSKFSCFRSVIFGGAVLRPSFSCLVFSCRFKFLFLCSLRFRRPYFFAREYLANYLRWPNNFFMRLLSDAAVAEALYWILSVATVAKYLLCFGQTVQRELDTSEVPSYRLNSFWCFVSSNCVLNLFHDFFLKRLRLKLSLGSPISSHNIDSFMILIIGSCGHGYFVTIMTEAFFEAFVSKKIFLCEFYYCNSNHLPSLH